MLSTPEMLPSVRLWPILLGLLTLLVIFGWLGEEVWRHGGFGWEKASLLALHAAASPGLDRLMAAVSVLGGPRVMLPLAFMRLFGLWWRRPRGWRINPFAPGTASRTPRRFSHSCPDLWRPALIVVGAAAMNVLAKLIVHRARPHFWPSIAPETDYSFPSGHAMISLAVLLAAVLLAWPTRWRWPLLLLGGLFVGLIGLSRLYLGVHYPSDVLAGWAAGGAWGCAVLLTARRPARGTVM